MKQPNLPASEEAPVNTEEAEERGERRYVIHRHQARHLHWDLRLEWEGVLKSWAVPKEPPSEPGVRRLAIETEDHPLEYASFEGVIPEGQYGAGTVEIWDSGTFKPERWSEKEIIVHLQGRRLSGRYCLIRFPKVKGGWLLFKCPRQQPRT